MCSCFLDKIFKMFMMYLRHFFILLGVGIACGQKTTNTTDEKITSDLQNRVFLLEKAIGKILTGNNDANLTNISVLKIPRGGFGIPILNSTPIAFSAAQSGPISGISIGYILKFDKVITNLGNHYNPTDGIFIAPVHGLYMFHWTMNCYNSGSNHCGTSLRVNSALKGRIYSGEDGSGFYHTGSNTVIVEVQAGQHVWIQTSNWGNVYMRPWSSFSGSLLSVM
ncbi:complement C1q-like protein 2 [Ostrea edulis]|uniref:complement C1q-like protein 2 n=1 Tax=Ostrea edulis TaxID=37623 RepID=UPI0024AF7FF3|nr:complement C1q-like protein 2 [Ostrea edulis]